MPYFNFPPKHARLVAETPETPHHVSVQWMQWFQELRDGLDAGNYTPTLTVVANVGVTTVREARWMKIGRIVSVSGAFDYTPVAAAGTNTQVRLSLPLPSNFTGFFDLSGDGVSLGAGITESSRVISDATNDAALVEWFSGAAGVARTMFYTYLYDLQ